MEVRGEALALGDARPAVLGRREVIWQQRGLGMRV